VLGCLKSDERSIQSLPLPVRLAVAPTRGVSGNTVNEFVMSYILRALVGIPAARARRANQRQSNGMVVWFIRSVLAISQDGRAELTACVGQVNPLVRRHLELLGLGCGPFNRADIPVVGCHLVGSRQRKRRFQI